MISSAIHHAFLAVSADLQTAAFLAARWRPALLQTRRFLHFPRYYKLAVFSISHVTTNSPFSPFPTLLQTRRFLHFPRYYKLAVFSISHVTTNSPFSPFPALLQTRRFLHFSRYYKLAVFSISRISTNLDCR